MTETTDTTAPARDPSTPEEPTRDPSTPEGPARGAIIVRFLIAFVIGIAAVLAFSVGALLAYDRNFDTRILPGVKVGQTDLSGLTVDEARAALERAYGAVEDGEIALVTPAGNRTLTFAAVDRRPDVDTMVAQAMSAGRTTTGPGRLFDNARTALAGIAIEPRVTFDHDAMAAAVEAAARTYDVDPIDARIEITDTDFAIRPASPGRHANPATAIDRLAIALGALDAPERIEVELSVETVEPAITTAEAEEARAAAGRIAQDVSVTNADEHWEIGAATVHDWISFATTPDGRYEPVLATVGLQAALKPVAKAVKTEPKDASFLFGKNGSIVGVTAGKNGRDLDVDATAELVTDLLRGRAAGQAGDSVEAALRETPPALTTEQAEQTAPQMKEISRWTTYFPISERNGFGANIWIPALDIDGYVVAPGARFDFWDAVGPITRERGYKDGGAIINGKTEPTGALAGGICSCSTTLFNAAVRAGLEMGARKNHFYYIDRYPLGLDATVFKSGSGSVQTMSFKNDTQFPILIRGLKIRNGSSGYVRFILYSVPTGRKVTFSTPIVKNVQRATDTVVYVSSLPAGRRERIEYPVDGKDVWVTRTVTAKDGTVLHKETYYSHYSRITGVVQVGRSSAPPPPSPTPTPPPPSPTPTPPPGASGP